MKKCKIKRIYEPDFGCEGLPEGEIIMDDVVLEDELGNMLTMSFPDMLLYRLELDEGDWCCIDESGNIMVCD